MMPTTSVGTPSSVMLRPTTAWLAPKRRTHSPWDNTATARPPGADSALVNQRPTRGGTWRTSLKSAVVRAI